MKNSYFYKLSVNELESIKNLDELIDAIHERIKNATDGYEKSFKEGDEFDQGWWTGARSGLVSALSLIIKLQKAQNEKHSGK